jgi:hypothetical protein
MARKSVIICVIMILVVGAAVTMFVLGRPSGPPKLSVRFLAFTNAAGTRLASFVISNDSPWAVTRESGYHIQVPVGRRWSTITNDWFPTGGRVLRPGQTETLTIAAPVQQPQWRIAFPARRDGSAVTVMATELLIEAQKRGLPTRYRRVAHSVASDLIQE